MLSIIIVQRRQEDSYEVKVALLAGGKKVRLFIIVK